MVKNKVNDELARIAAILKVDRFDIVAMNDFRKLVKSMTKADRVALGETLAEMLVKARS